VNEFTGERVIPGQVEMDLWNEHYSRYAFAARFAAGRTALDLGSGSGYGAAELSRAARFVCGLDVSLEAMAYARDRFPLENLRFLAASAAAVPLRDSTFDLITAFEVIEHLDDWPSLIREAHRLLTEDGIFLVSTPNALVYTESRGTQGANPFHVHEFEAAEFETELRRSFPHVEVLLQNRSEAFVFSPAKTFRDADARVDSGGGGAADAHFFLAVCGKRLIREQKTFVYVPRAANVLRERELHIALLDQDLRHTREEQQRLLEAHSAQQRHLEEQNRWAIGLEREWKAALERVAQLQRDFAAEQQAALNNARSYEAKVAELEEDARQKANWALDTEKRLSAEIAELRSRLQETLDRLAAAEATITERTQWALDLQAKLGRAESQIAGARASRWVKTGRLFGIGPEL
jgi:SAM-dependent methyltransferase